MAAGRLQNDVPGQELGDPFLRVIRDAPGNEKQMLNSRQISEPA